MIHTSFITLASDRVRIILLTLGFVACSVVLVVVPMRAIAEEPRGTIGVGDRVVFRSEKAALRADDREELRSRRENHIYRVEALSGASLTLKAEGDCIVGVLLQTEIVSVSQGIDFFTDRLDANASDAFAYVMRSLLWLDKRELEIAARDAEEAVRRAPRDPRVYLGRGQIRLARRELDQALADFSEAIRLEPRSAGFYNLRGQGRAAKKASLGMITNAMD